MLAVAPSPLLSFVIVVSAVGALLLTFNTIIVSLFERTPPDAAEDEWWRCIR